jgi:26S proteasome regulatory subunit N2
MSQAPNVYMNTAMGILSLINEDNAQLQVYALKKLITIVDQYWFEIADFLANM